MGKNTTENVETKFEPFEYHDGRGRLRMSGLWGEEYEVAKSGKKKLAAVYMKVHIVEP